MMFISGSYHADVVVTWLMLHQRVWSCDKSYSIKLDMDYTRLLCDNSFPLQQVQIYSCTGPY